MVASVQGKSLVDQSLDLNQVILKQLLFAVQKKSTRKAAQQFEGATVDSAPQ
jgi:hypothetical protein